MAKTYDLYETPEWADASPEERELLDSAESKVTLLEHPTLADKYVSLDEAGQRNYESRMTQARQNAFPQYFAEEPVEAAEPDTPQRLTHDAGVPFTTSQRSAHEQMNASRIRYPGGIDQVKQDEQLYKTIRGGYAGRFSDNEVDRVRTLLDDPRVTRESLTLLEDDEDIQQRLDRVTGIKGQMREFDKEYDALAKQSDNSAIESIRPRATALKSEIELLEVALPPQAGDRSAVRPGIMHGLPRQTARVREAEARAKKVFGEDADLPALLKRKKEEQKTLALNLQMNLLASDEASGHRPTIRGEYRRGNTPEWIDLIPPLADIKDATEMFNNIKLLDAQQEAQALGKPNPLSELEQAQTARFLIEVQNEGKGSRGLVATMNGLADMYPYALAIATGTGVVSGGRKVLLKAAGKDLKKRAVAHLISAGGVAGVATTVSTGSIVAEAGRKSIDPDVLNAEFNTEEGRALTNYLDLENPVSDDFTRHLLSGYADNYLENMTEMVGGGVTRGLLFGRAQYGRRVLAANVKKLNPHMKPGKVNEVLLKFEQLLGNKHAKKLTKIGDAVMLGGGTTKIQKGLGAIGFDGVGGEILEEGVAAMKDTLFELGIADDDKSAHNLAQKLMNPTNLFDPTQGGDAEDWGVLVATIGLPGTLRLGSSANQAWKNRQTKRRLALIKKGEDLLTNEDGTRVVPEGNLAQELEILNVIEQGERAEQQAKVDTAEEAIVKQEEALEDRIETNAPETHVEARRKVLSRRLDEYAAALFDQRTTEAEITERRTLVEGSSQSQIDRLHEAVGEMDAWHEKAVGRLAHRRANGFVSTKEWKETVQALVTGLTPIHLKRDRFDTEDKIYRTLRFGGASPRAKRVLIKEFADVVRGGGKRIAFKKGGIIHMSQALSQVAPSMFNRLNYHELGQQIRKAENEALESVEANATEAVIVKAMEDAGRAVVSTALDAGFFPIKGVQNAGHKKLLQQAQKEIEVWEDVEGDKYTVLNEEAWSKFSPQEQRTLARYLTRVADLPEGANLFKTLTAVTVADLDASKLKKKDGRRKYLRETLGDVAPNLIALLDDTKLAGHWDKIVVVPDTVVRTTSKDSGHFGTEGQNQLVSRAFNVGSTLYISPSATRADLTEENIERQMSENGFFTDPVTTGIATEGLRSHVHLLLTQLQSKARELQEEAANKGMPASNKMTIVQNKGLPNESSTEIRLDEAIAQLESFQEQLSTPNENRTLFEFLSSIYTIHIGGAELSTADREAYSRRSDVKAYTALVDLALTFPESKDAFNNFLVNMTELYFPSKDWTQVQDPSKTHPQPLGGAFENSKSSRLSLAWSLTASSDFIDSQYDIADDSNPISTPQSILAEMVGGVWDESVAADEADISEEMLEQTMAQAEADEAQREVAEADALAAEAADDLAAMEEEGVVTPAVDHQAEADRLGIEFEGLQEQFEALPLPMFSADGKSVTFVVPEGQTVEETLAERRADQAKKAKPEVKNPPFKPTVDRRGEEEAPEHEKDVIEGEVKEPVIAPTAELDLSLHGGIPIKEAPNMGALIKAANAIKDILGGNPFEITGRKIMPRSTLSYILKNPDVLGELSHDQLQLMIDRIDLFNGVEPSATNALTGEPLTNEELLERLISEVLSLSDAVDLKYTNSPLVTGGVPTVEEIKKDEPPKEEVPSPDVAGAKAAQNLLSEYLKESSPLHEYGAVATYVEELISGALLNGADGQAWVKAFMESYYYRSPVPKTTQQLRLVSESIASRVTIGLQLKAIEGAAAAEGETEIEEDEDQELVAGGDNTQFLEYDVRFAADTKKLFEKLKLQGTFGPRFVMKAIQESSSIRAVIKQGAAINSRWLDDSEYTLKERNRDIERVVVDYLNHGKYRAEESLLVDTLQKAGLSNLAIFNAFRDLTTRFHKASTRPASKIEAGLKTVGTGRQVFLKTTPYTSNTGASMVSSLATNLTRKLSTKAEAIRFFDLVEGVSKMSREYVYNFWELMLSEPAEVLEYSDVKIGEHLKEDKPGLPQSAKELGPLFAFAKDPNAKGNWPAIVSEYRKKVMDAKPEEFQELMAEVSRKLRLGGLTTAATAKAKGLNRIAQIALNMPDSTAPASFRRPDGTLKSNINSPDQLTQMIDLERELVKADLGEDHPLWILRELDMIDARKLRGGRRALKFEDLLESEHVRIHRNIWETARRKNQKYYDAWSGPIGDKTSIRTVSMPLKTTYAEAVAYYEETIAEGGPLVAEERAHEAVKSVEDILAAGERGQLDNSEAGLAFEFNDRANRLRIMHAVHGNFAKFGGSTAFTKRASATGSSGVTMTKEGFGDSNLKALRLKDARFLITALQLPLDKAQLAVDNAKSKQAKQRAQAQLDRLQAEADDFLLGKKDEKGVRKGGIESTDGAALIMPQARDRIQWAYGPLLTQEDKYGSLKVAKTIHTGHEGLDKQGATILTEDYANHAEGSAYRIILDAIAAHLKKIDPKMEDEVAQAGGRGDNRIDVVFFSSGDKAKSGNEYDLFAEGASQEVPDSALTDVPVDDFYWLLSASHGTQASAMAMPVQAVAVLSALPGVFNDALDIQDASVAYAASVAQDQLAPKNVIEPDDHAMAPYALGDHPLIPIDNVFMSSLLSNKQSIKLSKESRPVIMGNQLVETPIAAPPEVLMDYYKVSESDDGLWDADENGTRVRLARADFNSDNVRFALTTTARTVEKAEELMRNPDVFPMVLDMFDIPRAVLKDLPETFDADFINTLTFRSWELEKDGEFIRIPGEPVLVQRVPSDGVYSTSMVRAGKRMLTESGESPNIIATSQGVQIGSGADFDIDKRFIMSMRRSNTKAADIPEGPGRDFAEQTFVANKELKQSRTNVGYDLTSARWSSYNRFLLGMTTDFGSVDNFDAITSKLDGDLNKRLVDKAIAEAELKGQSASWEQDLASIYGAAHLYKLNSVGKKGLGRAATAMFSAGVMHGLGYGVVRDQSFDFTTEVNGAPTTLRIKINRLAGDRSNFQIARSSIGLVMNQYTDHTKLQVIDKLGGDEITASLFATLYYLNKDLVPDDAPAEGKDTVSDYGEVIWRALASPEIQAWVSLQQLSNKIDLTPADLKLLRGMENEKTPIPMITLGKMFEAQNPGVKPNQQLWDIILGGSQEMLDIERLFRGYRNPMPTDPISMFRKKQGWMNRANGIVGRDKVGKEWVGIPALFQMKAHATPDAQAMIINHPFEAMKRPVHHAYRPTLTTASTAVEHIAGLAPVTKDGKELTIETALDAPTHRAIYNQIRENITDATISRDTGEGYREDVTADTSKEGLEKIRTSVNRLVFATAIMASYPERVGRKELVARIDAGLKDAYLQDKNNVFLTEGISTVTVEGSMRFEVPSGTAGNERTKAELDRFHSGFTNLPAQLKQDLLMYAVMRYGMQMHTSYGSYLPYIDPSYLIPFVNGANSLDLDNFNFQRMEAFAILASISDRPQVLNLNDVSHDAPKIVSDASDATLDAPARPMTSVVKKVLLDSEALTEEEAENLEHTEGDAVEHHKPEAPAALDYELHGVSKADWDTYFEYRHVPTTAATVAPWTLRNYREGDMVEILSAEAFDDSKDFVKYLEGLPEGALVNQTVSVFDFAGNVAGTVLEDTSEGLIVDVIGTGKHTSERRLIVDIPLGKKTQTGETPVEGFTEEDKAFLAMFKKDFQPILRKSNLDTEAKREAAKQKIAEDGYEIVTGAEQAAVFDAAIAFIDFSAEDPSAIRSTITRVQKAVREKAQTTKQVTEDAAANTAALITGDTAAEIKAMMESDPRDIDGGLTQSAFFTKMIKVDAQSAGGNRRGREMLLKHTRKTEEDHTILSAAAKRWQSMTNSRDGTYDNIYQDERAGEAMLKALTVMYEAGIRTEADFRKAQTAQNLYDEAPKNAQPKDRVAYNEYLSKNPKVVRAGLLYYWDSPEDVVKVDAHRGGGYVVPKSKRISITDVVRDYDTLLRENNTKLKPKDKKWMSTWGEVMSDYSKTLDDAVKRMNDNVGYNWITKPDDRVFHVTHTPSDRGSTSAPSALGSPEEAETTFLENSSYLQMVKRGVKPASFNISENFAAWLNSASAKARLVGVLRSSAMMVDVNGVPGMVMGATATEAGEKLTPYDRDAGFIMLTNLRKKLSERPELKLPPIRRGASPWVQAAELAEAYPKAMKGLGYVQLKTHALGPNVDQVWAIQGTLDKVVRHVSVVGFRGHLQQAKSEGGLFSPAGLRTAGWGTLSALLSATKFLKGLNVGFSAFHHFALAESAVANVGLTFKNPIFHLGNYWMAGRRGLKLYREMASDPELMGKWAGRGLKATTLPLDALHYEMSSGWFSRAGNALRNDGKGIFKKTKFGDAVGSTVLFAGNVKKAADNFLWHGMVPVMKVHMAEQMFEQFRANPQLKHLTDEQLGHDISKYVNDALGGQEWEQYMFMNPLMQDWANMIMFAPDWTLSAINVSGMSKAMSSAFGIDGPMNYTDDATQGNTGPFTMKNGKFEFTGSPLARQRVLKYLPGFFMNVLIMPPVAIQAMIFLAFGAPDDGDEMWVWNNEEGKKFRIDFTPILRHYLAMRGKEPPERRAYWTPGKQLREIGGWLQHPAKTLYGKTSNVVRMGNLIIFRSKTHPFSPQPWTVDREDVAMEAMYTMLPFVASGWLSDKEVPLGMRTFLTVTRGASEWTLARRASEVYKDAASGKGYRGLSSAVRVRKLNAELDEIWRVADINNVSVRTVQIEGRKQARTEFNATLTEEMAKVVPDASVLEEMLLSLAVLEPNYSDRLDSLKRTVDYRVKKSAKLSKEEKARIQNMYDSFKFRALIRRTTDAHAKAWGRTGGVSIDLDSE